MSISDNRLQNIINTVTHDIGLAYPGLSLYFITHHHGKLRESISLAEHEIISHPAGNAARAIVKKFSNSEQSSFLGLAIHSKSSMMGLRKEENLLGLFNVNKSDFADEKEARALIYQLSWHAIDLYDIRTQKQYRNKFKSGPMIPKRSAMNTAKANLQADAFAIILAKLKHEEDLLPYISQKRAQDALGSKSNYKPEQYPSVIAMEACKIAMEELANTPTSTNDILATARQFSTDIGHTFDEENIKQWWNFSIPAQDMAWREYSKDHILGAAIHTSNDPYVRSIGYLVQEVTEIEPINSDTLHENYNTFIDQALLRKLHNEMVENIFEDAIAQGLEEASSRSFLNAANRLNESLTEGNIIGWCSNALQDAAHAFERALLNGAQPEQAARMQFEGNKNAPHWDALKNLGKKIVDQKRQGFAVTMGHIAEICHNNPAFAPVLDSLKITMNDPSYVQKLEAANDFAMTNIPAPVQPAPQGPAPNAPVPNAPALHNAPTFGGGSSGHRQAVYHRQRQAQLEKEKAESTTEETQ